MCVAISLHKVKKSVSEIKSVIELLKHEEVDIMIKIPQKTRCVHTYTWRGVVYSGILHEKWYSAKRYINGSGENLQLVCTYKLLQKNTSMKIRRYVCLCLPHNMFIVLLVHWASLKRTSHSCMCSIAVWQLLYEPLPHLFSHLLFADEGIAPRINWSEEHWIISRWRAIHAWSMYVGRSCVRYL